MRAAFEKHRTFIDRIGRSISESPDAELTLPQVARWIEDRAREGCRIIAVDPITAVTQTAQPWIHDNAFVVQTKRIARQYGASILLVTHPRKGGASQVDMDSLAGGAAYARFAQTILWLQSHDDKTVTTRTCCGQSAVEANRTVHILKARNGVGTGARLALRFSREDLAVTEIGIIIKAERQE